MQVEQAKPVTLQQLHEEAVQLSRAFRDSGGAAFMALHDPDGAGRVIGTGLTPYQAMRTIAALTRHHHLTLHDLTAIHAGVVSEPPPIPKEL